MSDIRYIVYVSSASLLLLAGCATSPEAENRHQAKEADIQAILAVQLDPAEYGETKRCLSDVEYRTFRALDDQRILFEGRRNKLWINTLRGRCPELRWGDVLIVRQFASARMCDGDRFTVGEWFDFPWYRRWPWHWGPNWGMGMECMLGKFQPVTENQVAEIEAVLERR